MLTSLCKRAVFLLLLFCSSGFGCLQLALAQSGKAGVAPLTILLEPVPPFSYPDAKGKPAGYAVELMEELLKRSGLSFQTEFNSWASIYHRALKQPQTLIISMARLPEREPHFHWIGPTMARRAYLYSLKSRPEIQASTLEAAKAYKIAVVREDATERALLTHGFGIGKQLDRSPDHAAMLRKLFVQRDELIAANSIVLTATMEKLGYDPKLLVTQAKLSEASLYMGLSKGEGSQAINLKLQAAWESMRQDGTVAAIAARHPHVSQAKIDH